jgi:hypothetical protein
MPGKASGGFGDAQLPVNHLPAAVSTFFIKVSPHLTQNILKI